MVASTHCFQIDIMGPDISLDQNTTSRVHVRYGGHLLTIMVPVGRKKVNRSQGSVYQTWGKFDLYGTNHLKAKILGMHCTQSSWKRKISGELRCFMTVCNYCIRNDKLPGMKLIPNDKLKVHYVCLMVLQWQCGCLTIDKYVMIFTPTDIGTKVLYVYV